MFGKQERAFLATRGTQIKPFAGKRPEIIMPAIGVRTPNSCNTLHIVPAGEKVFAYFPGISGQKRRGPYDEL